MEKYEEPLLEVSCIDTYDVITLSLEASGSGGDIDGTVGGWAN